VTARVKNVSKNDSDVSMVLAVRSCSYWNRSRGEQDLAEKEFEKKTLKAGESEF
jgi:hypothetical protein